MNTYKFRYRRSGQWFWRSLTVIGHNYAQNSDHMDVWFADGTIRSIGAWKDHDLKLGKDWIEFTRRKMAEESGLDMKLKGHVGG